MKLVTETPPYRQLTHEVIRPINGRSVTFTLMGTLMLLFLANWAVLWLSQAYPYNRGYWVVQQKWELLQNLTAPVDWLIVGDSTGNQGLVPDVFEERLGGTAVNLSTEGGMVALDDVWLLEDYIEKFGPPAHVLIIHSYDAWHRDVETIYIAKTPLSWNSWQNAYIPSLSLTAQESFNVWLARYVPLYADNVSLGKLIRQRIYGWPIFERRYKLQEDGFMPLESVPNSAFVYEDLETHLNFVANSSFVMSDVNRQALAQLKFLAETYHIEMYLAFGPMYEGLAEEEAFKAYFNLVQTELQSFADQSENVHLLPTTAVFPADQLENVDHVILDAARLYTNLIASDIEKLQQ